MSRVALVSALLHQPGMVGYNRLSVSLGREIARQTGDELIWLGLPGRGVHPAIAAQLPGRVHQLPGPERVVNLQRQFRRADRELRPRVWHVLTDEPVPWFARSPVVVTCCGLPRWLRVRQLRARGELPGRFWDYVDGMPGRVAYQAMAQQYLMWKANLRRADLILAISDYVRRELIAHFGVPARKIVVSYLAADAVFFAERSAAELAEARARLGLPPRFLLAVSSFAVTKNTAGVVELAAGLRAAGVELPAVLIGPAGARERYEEQAGQLGLVVGRDIFFLGGITDDDLARAYRLGDLFVNLAWEESFALPVAEAMASGAAVVGSCLTAVPEIIGGGGVTADPRDPPGVVRVVRDLLAAPARLAELRGRAKARAADFCWKRAAREALAAYDRVARRG